MNTDYIKTLWNGERFQCVSKNLEIYIIHRVLFSPRLLALKTDAVPSSVVSLLKNAKCSFILAGQISRNGTIAPSCGSSTIALFS